MPFGYPVYARWLSCLCPLVFLFMPFGIPAYALWLSCLCPLAILFMPFGYPVYALWYSCSQNFFWLYLFPNFWLWAPAAGYSRNASYVVNYSVRVKAIKKIHGNSLVSAIELWYLDGFLRNLYWIFISIIPQMKFRFS